MRDKLFTRLLSVEGRDALKLVVHPSPHADAIIINLPGYKSELDGYNGKYRKIGAMLSEKKIGACIQMPNNLHTYHRNESLFLEDLRAVITYAKRETWEMCWKPSARIYLAGVSAGAIAVSTVASEYEEVEKILLVAPSLTSRSDHNDLIKRGIGDFKGEVSITVGETDMVTGILAAHNYYEFALRAKVRRFVPIPSCDHQFSGTRNGQILCNAYLWAFAGEGNFPSPDGGLELY